jgi:hypothetical protein
VLVRGYGGVSARPQTLVGSRAPRSRGPEAGGSDHSRRADGRTGVRFYGIRCLTKLPTRSIAWVASGKKPQRPM